MKRTLSAAIVLAALFLSGCCGPGQCGPRGCGPQGGRPMGYATPPGRAYVHSHPGRALFTEWQHPLIDPNGQYRLMGDNAFRKWQCEPAVKMQPVPE